MAFTSSPTKPIITAIPSEMPTADPPGSYVCVTTFIYSYAYADEGGSGSGSRTVLVDAIRINAGNSPDQVVREGNCSSITDPSYRKLQTTNVSVPISLNDTISTSLNSTIGMNITSVLTPVLLEISIIDYGSGRCSQL
jgi:hypothetical protein